MTPKVKPGEGVLYMKVGTHAKESLEDIVERKRREIKNAGYGLWGYGGNTCHPINMVQPFGRHYHRKGGVIYLLMEPMRSSHFAEPLRADQYSIDGFNWQRIPQEINVLGSRYALVIKSLEREELGLDLSRTKVALGNCMGRLGNKYISGRVDKACLEVIDDDAMGPLNGSKKRIELVAEVAEPYAVFVGNSTS